MNGNNSEAAFQTYLKAAFLRAKHTRRTLLAQKIVDSLKGKENDDKAFRYFVKKSCFQLLDLPAVGNREGIHKAYIYIYILM